MAKRDQGAVGRLKNPRNALVGVATVVEAHRAGRGAGRVEVRSPTPKADGRGETTLRNQIHHDAESRVTPQRTDETLGEFIRVRREARGLSIRALAERLKKSATFVSDVEHNRIRPSEETCVLLARELSVEVEDLKSRECTSTAESKAWLALHPELSLLLRREEVRRRLCVDLILK